MIGGPLVEAEKYDKNSPIAPFVIQTGAGGIEYIVATTADLTVPTEASNTAQAFYSFKATATQINVYATVNLPLGDADSFHYQITGLSTWATKNGMLTTGFQEISLMTVNNAVIGQTYVLKIQRREAGAQFDKFRLEGGTFENGGAATNGGGGGGSSGPSLCDSAGALLCESFENGLDETLWTKTVTGDTSLVVDEVHAKRGTKALHVKTVAGVGRALITEKKSFPVPMNNLYGRMFLWFEDPVTTNGHFSLAEGAGVGDGSLIRFGGQFQKFGVGSDHGASGDWTDFDTINIPTKKWICVEFQFQGPTNMFRVWTDGLARTALTSGANRHGNFVMPQFNSLWFGWWMYNDKEPQDVWFDEIVVDSKPIGCDK